MPVKKMSYNTANKIFDVYTDLLVNLDKLDKYQKYSYADLKGYDIIDVSNALKLLAADRFFNSYNLDDNKLVELKKYASQDGSALLQFFSYFFPEEINEKLKKLNPNDEMAIIEYVNARNSNQNSEMYNLLNKQETPDSFLDYCIAIGRKDPNYWGKIYKRIDITWETDNDKDRIYFLIKNKVNFEAEQVDNYEIHPVDINNDSTKSKSFFDSIKKFFRLKK